MYLNSPISNKNNHSHVTGIDSFMLVIANNLLRDNRYGMILRVSTGAVLSVIDAVSDLYILNTYFSQGLDLQAYTLLAMIVTSMFLQILCVFTQYKKKSWGVMARELLITLLFLRPAVDAFRVSTNHKDDDATFDNLAEMFINKVSLLTSYIFKPKITL